MDRNERRMFDRFEVDFPTEIKQPDWPEKAGAQCCDISASGVGLHCPSQLRPQTKLELWLAFPNGHTPYRGLARVIWSSQIQENKWRLGLELETIDFMGLRRIFATLSK